MLEEPTPTPEALYSWEIELALKVGCPRCGAMMGARCVHPNDGGYLVYNSSGAANIHPMRLVAYYKSIENFPVDRTPNED